MKKLMDAAVLKAQIKLQHLFEEERGAVDIVAIVVLIGIAVVLAGIFRKGIAGLINTLLNTIEGGAKNAVK